jgi:hypothetical protein
MQRTLRHERLGLPGLPYVQRQPPRPEAAGARGGGVLSYANARGAPLLVGWAGALSTVTLPTQLAGQAVLFELINGVRDARAMQEILASAAPPALAAWATSRELARPAAAGVQQGRAARA